MPQSPSLPPLTPPPNVPPPPPPPNETIPIAVASSVGVVAALALGMLVYWLIRSYRRQKRQHLTLLHEVELKSLHDRTLVSEDELRRVHSEVQGITVSSNASVRSSLGADHRFTVEPDWLITGQPQHAALGVNFYLQISDDDLRERMIHSMLSIRREFADHGTDEDKECLDYILNQRAGSSDLMFPNGVRDQGRSGETLVDFVNHPSSRQSGLTEAHVLALRLYTSAAYRSINQPLREQERTAPHPFPVTVNLIAEGLRRLRAVGAKQEDANTSRDLWRGMRNLQVTDEFITEGGTEIAPMSATTDLRTALRYALSPNSLLFKIVTKNFMARGVDLSYLSCFPEESEHLFPPLTYLCPTGNTQTIESGDVMITVVEVEPTFGT